MASSDIGHQAGQGATGVTRRRATRSALQRFPCIAYCNCFLRPAPVSGGSMAGHAFQQDLEVAEEVLKWFILRHRPQLVIITSRFTGRHAERVTRKHGIPPIAAPHPGSRWWNTITRSYGNVRGRDRFLNFLITHH